MKIKVTYRISSASASEVIEIGKVEDFKLNNFQLKRVDSITGGLSEKAFEKLKKLSPVVKINYLP